MAGAGIAVGAAMGGGAAGGAAGGALAGGLGAAGWGALLSGAGNVLGGLAGGIGGKGGAKAARRLRRRATRAASPKRFQSYMKTYEPYIKRLMDPQRVAMADAMGLGEQAVQRSTDADAARYGLMGSGAHLEQRRANKLWRQGALTENTREMYLRALVEAMGLAERAQDRKIRAILGVPADGGGSRTAGILGGIGGGLMQTGGNLGRYG